MPGDLDCDAVIVGSGPGGSTVADVLTAAGWSVIVLEKGRNHLVSLEAPFDPSGDLSNDEIKFSRRHFLGPDPFLEPRTYRRSEADGERLITGEVNNLPSTVGGGGFHADGKLPRLREEDFHLLSFRGGIDGAAVADWPVQYDDLEPHYAIVERLIGVAGDADANPFAAWRSGPYPMPPGPDMFGAILTSEAAAARGLHPYRAPTGVNSVPYDDRPACNNCGYCGGFGCPIHAKGDPISSLRRALRTGRCEVRPDAYVTEIMLDGGRRRATGVRYLDVAARNALREVRAAHVVLAAGAFETPRLLLRSEVGNSSNLVGRNLMYHFQTFTVGIFPFSLHGERGRSVTHLHDDFMVPDEHALAAAHAAGLPWIRGGTVEHGGGGTPLMESMTYPSGPQHNVSMRDSAIRDRLFAFTMQAEDLPQPSNRVDLDPSIVDAWGFAAGRVTYRPHAHELVASDHYAPLLEAVMQDAGAEFAFSTTSPPQGDLDLHDISPLGIAPASRHVMGTCRMGDDPRTSVVDSASRFHDVENMICADSSVFVTSAGYNPTLTLVALAHRAACQLAAVDVLDVPNSGSIAGP
ncbi:MAG TPA: GMC family oxidoreductase [Acidimicrobiales bacterium]